MTKYNDVLKLKIPQEYLDGLTGTKLSAIKYDMSSDSPIQNWIKSYKVFGEEGIRRKYSKKIYSVQFKLDVLQLRD